jgi:hypothetical protein
MKHKNLLPGYGLLAILCLNSLWLIAQPPPTAGLVGHFKFDGNLSNSAPTTMSATSFSTTYGANGAGVANKAIQFGGTTSSYASITDNGNLDFTGDFSIAFGVYTTSVTVNHGYYDNGLNYGGCGIWFFQSDNTLRFNFKNGSIGAVGALPVNQWRAVCAVRSGTTMKLYVSGTQVATGTEGTTGISYPYAPVLGQMFYQGTGGNYNPSPNGTRIDEMRFYNRALSAAEIALLVGYSLPIKMGDFTAVQKPTGIQLNWETLTEQNSSHFDVERSADGVNFTTIGRVNAKGNSTNKQSYSFPDETPVAGINFYRLKLSDIDNSYTYSRIVAVKSGGQPVSVELFPNPASSLLQVQLPARQKETIRLFITDASGRMIDSRFVSLSEGNNALSIPVSHLPNGTYFLSIENKDGRQTKTFLKR